MLNITVHYKDLTISTVIGNDNNDIVLSTLLLSTPSELSFLSLLIFVIWKVIIPLTTNEKMDKLLYPHFPVRCINTGPSECGKSFFLEN